ncbi:MAG: N-acetyltransferase [Muribaculaceae bacterium]|nr:N-acetyltransferase [Muribaculaceae bacterium]
MLKHHIARSGLEFFPTENGVSTIDHTFVDPSLRGQGIAGKLVKLAADKILEEGNKIAATCTYAVAWFKRHPEYHSPKQPPLRRLPTTGNIS